MQDKMRLDQILLSRGLVESRSQAQRMIMAGYVRVNDQVIIKPATHVFIKDRVTVERRSRFVSRGGEKLESALLTFPIVVKDRICADIGSSTGGFTDCLLQFGAARVYAIDVGAGLLDWRLRNDHRVVVMEKTNARHVDHLPEPVDIITIDASFISLKILLPVTFKWFDTLQNGHPKGDLIALIKPQFEAGRNQVSRGKGVIRDPNLHINVLKEVLMFAQRQNYIVQNVIRSPLLGPKGNIEFLVWLNFSPGQSSTVMDLIQSLFEIPAS